MPIDHLVIHDVPIECINQAAVAYHVPATIIVSVLLTENGRAGTAHWNTNNTYDYGPMQINTIWIDKVKPYGITKDDIQYNPCKNVWVGTWILSQRIADSNNIKYGVGSYNSYSLPQNYRYSNKVSEKYRQLINFLSSPIPKM